MNVLSLFDGMSCGRIALERAGIKIDKYYASEIDKYAIRVSQKNYPDIIQLGDINNWQEWKLPLIDLLIGGSPCQGFSFAGKQLNFEDPRSKLFFQYVDILNHYKPKYFLLENVKMKKEYQKVITEKLGVEPIEINSGLVSAQDRKRLYWTNIPGIQQPKNMHIYLKDILETEGIVGRVVGRRIKDGKRADYDYSIKPIQRFEPRTDNKSGTLTTVTKDNMVLEKKYLERYQPIKNYKLNQEKSCVIGTLSKYQGDRVFDVNGKGSSLSANGGNNAGGSCNIIWDNNELRKLTPVECERLQTLPDNYTEGVSNTQRYKMIGNGWTVDVIAHIFSYLKIDK
jgi:DNA-cytosine methyltransferase